MEPPNAPILSPHLVVLNDTGVILDLVRLILEPEGYRVTATTREEVALKAMLEAPCDLFIQDIERPDGAGGWEILLIMQQNDQLRAIPKMILSAHVETEWMLREIQPFGVSEYLHVPFDTFVLRRRVRHVLAWHAAGLGPM